MPADERCGGVGVWGYGRVVILDFGFWILDCLGKNTNRKSPHESKATDEASAKYLEDNTPIRNPQLPSVSRFARVAIQNHNPPTLPHSHTPTPNAIVSPKRTRLLAAWAVLACLLAVSLSACEEDVVAVLGTDLPFSMFGVLTPDSDTQWVRVFPIEGRLEPAPPGPLDAQFISTDLLTGETRVWRDSLIQEENDQFAHVFWSSFLTPFGRAYRLAVERPDGAGSQVEVAVPVEATLVMPPRTELAPALLPVFIEGDVPNLIRIEVNYRYRFRTPAGIDMGSATISYDGKQSRVEGGWLITLTPASDLRVIQRLLEQNIVIDTRIGLKLTKLTFSLIVANAEWDPPGGVFDAEVLVQPGTLSNVENGFGFVGAGYRLLSTWVPLDTIIVGDGS